MKNKSRETYRPAESLAVVNKEERIRVLRKAWQEGNFVG